MTKCATCGKDEDCRPYGRNGAWICFRCAMATPESKLTAATQFKGQLDACGGTAIIGEETGPRPYAERAKAVN